jgi:hypothetical protein
LDGNAFATSLTPTPGSIIALVRGTNCRLAGGTIEGDAGCADFQLQPARAMNALHVHHRVEAHPMQRWLCE